MPIEISIPRLGWSMEEGIFGEWLKAQGQLIREGEMVFVLEGEKASHEIESFDSGTLCIPSDAPKPGDTVKVGQIIGFLLAEGETAPTSCGNQVNRSASSISTSEANTIGQVVAQSTHSTDRVSAGNRFEPSMPRVAGPAARRLAREMGIDLNSVPTPDPTGRVIPEDIHRLVSAKRQAATRPSGASHAVATPRARRRANQLGLDWGQAVGSGREGRIRERDVEALASSRGRSTQNELPPVAAGKHRPASKIRQALSQRMLAGVQQTAPVTLTTKVDASGIVSLRSQLKANSSGQPVPSYNDMIVKLVASSLPECPLLNACWHRDGIWIYDDIHVSIAVDTESGLMAPVISGASRLSLDGIAEQSRLLIEQARKGTLSQNKLQGGTFTVTNLGMFDVDYFTPVINLPQSAILGVGRIVREPVVRDDAIVIGETLGLSLTFDHRVIDGAPAARWLQRLGQLIQSPECLQAE